MTERLDSTPADLPLPSLESQEIVSILVSSQHLLLRLKAALDWQALVTVMVTQWRAADKNVAGANKYPAFGDQRVAVEARMVAVLFDVVAPALLPALLIKGVVGVGAGADEHQVPGDRRGGPDSTTCFNLPQNSRISSLSDARRGKTEHSKNKENGSMSLHFASLSFS